MVISKTTMKLNNQKIVEVSPFNYLGSIISGDGTFDNEIMVGLLQQQKAAMP